MNVRDGSAFFRCLECRIRNFFWRDWKSGMLLRCGEIAGNSAGDDDLLLHDVDVCPVDRRKFILLIRRKPVNTDYRNIEIGKHTSELQSLMRISYAVFCLKKKKETILKIKPQTKQNKKNKQDGVHNTHNNETTT